MAFLEAGTVPETPIEQAALCMFPLLARERHSTSFATRLLSDAYELLKRDAIVERAAYVAAQRNASPELRGLAILARLDAHGIDFCDEEDLRSGYWRGPDGRYASTFQNECQKAFSSFAVTFEPAISRHVDTGGSDWEDDSPPRRGSVKLHLHGTRDQEIAARVIAAAPDDLVNLDAYAGTGKTHLLLAISEGLGGRLTYLAPTQAHIDGFRARVGALGDAMRYVLLAQLANQAASANAREHGMSRLPSIGKSGLSPSEQVGIANVPSIDGRPPVSVLAAIYKAITAWCFSASPNLEWFHFARYVPYAAIDATRWIQAAERVWACMFAGMRTASGLNAFDIRGSHLVKWLAVRSARLPAQHGILLVDEAHDLSAPWRVLLHEYSAGCVLMGDPYQRLFGRLPRAERAKSLMMRQSVRMGRQAEPLIDRTLEIGQERLMEEPIQGARNRSTRQRSYTAGDELPSRSFRVFGSSWRLFEEARRLAAAGARFRFVPASGDEMSSVVTTGISLFVGDDVSARGLGAFRSWSGLAAHLHKSGCGASAEAIERGFRTSSLGALFAAQAAAGHEDILIGLVHHCKNMEADAVVLSPCSLLGNGDGRLHVPVRAAYLAMTRARHEVWVPGDSLDRLQDAQRDFERGQSRR